MSKQISKRNNIVGLYKPTYRKTSVEPVSVEPVSVEPVSVEPASVEPASVEPVSVEPASVEPASVEPVSVLLYDDLYDKIRSNKNLNDLWLPLQNSNIVRLIHTVRKILHGFGKEFKIPGKTIEVLKMYSYFKNGGGGYQKFIPSQKELNLIIGYTIIRKVFDIQSGENNFKLRFDFNYGNQILNLNKEIELYKAQKLNYEVLLDNHNLVKKYILFNEEISQDTLINNAVEHYFKSSTNNTNNLGVREICVNLMTVVKKLVFVEFNNSTNFDWMLLESRLKKIRNGLSRTHSIAFYSMVEKSILRLNIKDIKDIKDINLVRLRKELLETKLIEIQKGKKNG